MAGSNLIERLRDQLPEGRGPGDESQSEGRRRALAILMSVVVAFILWLTFSMRESYSVVIEMPLQVTDLPDGRALSQRPPPNARVTVQGDGWQLLELSTGNPTLEVSAEEESVDIYRAAAESKRMPPGVTVQSVVPATITLAVEPRITRTLPVRLRSDIGAASIYDILEPPSVEPDTVVVSGARSIVNGLQYWPTDMVELEDVNETVVQRIPLSDTLAGLVATSVSGVELTVPVALFSEATRELEVRTEGAPPGADPIRFIPSSITATYRIPVDQYEASRETEAFYAFVPYSTAFNDTTGTIQPILHLPEALAVRDVRFEPRRLQYRIRVE